MSQQATEASGNGPSALTFADYFQTEANISLQLNDRSAKTHCGNGNVTCDFCHSTIGSVVVVDGRQQTDAKSLTLKWWQNKHLGHSGTDV